MEKRGIMILKAAAIIVALVITSGVAYATTVQTQSQSARTGGMMQKTAYSTGMMGRGEAYSGGMMGGYGNMMGVYNAASGCFQYMEHFLNSTSVP